MGGVHMYELYGHIGLIQRGFEKNVDLALGASQVVSTLTFTLE